MSRFRTVMPLVVASVVVAASAGLRMMGQDRASGPAAAAAVYPVVSVQDALHRPFHFTFAKPTRLDAPAVSRYYCVRSLA